jgi:hypothetical protein
MAGRIWPSVEQTAERGIRSAILAVFVAGVRRRNPAAVVNAVFSLAASFLPGIVERLYDVDFRPWQRVYVAFAMLAHAVGMLGPYDDTWWWDHVTHTLSATLLGGVVHVAAHRRGRNPLPRVLAAVVSLGVFWELVEYAVHRISDHLGLEPLLVHYSARDTLLDLVFNLLGALLVLVFGDNLLRNFTRRVD